MFSYDEAHLIIMSVPCPWSTRSFRLLQPQSLHSLTQLSLELCHSYLGMEHLGPRLGLDYYLILSIRSPSALLSLVGFSVLGKAVC